MATAPKAPIKVRDRDRQFILSGIRWETYEALRHDLEASHVHLTYDRGMLELMSPGRKHERSKRKFGRLIETMTMELGIPIESGGSTTFRRQLKKRGLEPDECYWLEHEPQVRGYDALQFDLENYPPPDLTLEVETSRNLLNKLPIYARLKFPEVWRFDGRSIRVEVLQPDGTYLSGDRSPNFPWLDLAALVRFHDQAGATDETTWINTFRVWVRADLAPMRDAWAR